MSVANSKQVGGNHYKTGTVEHWDVFGPEYLIASATKYVGRWRKKNGVQDLEKALHYAEKLRECDRISPVAIDWQILERWLIAIKADWVEQSIIKSLISYDENHNKINEAIAGIKYLIDRETPNDPDLFDTYHKAMQQRTTEDGAHHASVYPWVADDDSNMRRTDATFYSRRGRFSVLEPFIDQLVPMDLAQCYTYTPGIGSVLKIEDCPPDAREYFPSLIKEKNSMEHSELPAWQQGLYDWNGGKYVLVNDAWHVETE